MEWSVGEKKDSLYQIPSSWLHIHYFEALTILFRIENSLRVFVFSVLKNEKLENWHEAPLRSDDDASETIATISKKRIKQASDFGYLGFPAGCPVMYLTSGELTSIITHDKHWPFFSKFFASKKEIIRNKLDEIGVIRNALAHFRPIQKSDLDVIKQNAKHILMRVEQHLEELLHISKDVPSNFPEKWYLELKNLGSDICSFEFRTSKSGEWVEIRMRLKTVTIKKDANWSTTHHILKLHSASVINVSPELKHFITYFSEYSWSSIHSTTGEPMVLKNLSFVFNKKILQEKWMSIYESLNSIVNQVNEDSELLKKDQQALGKLLEIARLAGSKESGKWEKLDYSDDFSSPVTEADPPEYWGNLNFWSNDIVGKAHKLPWMAESFSEEEPFLF